MKEGRQMKRWRAQGVHRRCHQCVLCRMWSRRNRKWEGTRTTKIPTDCWKNARREIRRGELKSRTASPAKTVPGAFLVGHPKYDVSHPPTEGVVVLELFEELGVVFERPLPLLDGVSATMPRVPENRPSVPVMWRMISISRPFPVVSVDIASQRMWLSL